MKRLYLRLTGVFFLFVLIIGLSASQSVYADEQMKNENKRDSIVLYIPPGIRLSEIALENKPDYIVLNEDGTLPCLYWELDGWFSTPFSISKHFELDYNL